VNDAVEPVEWVSLRYHADIDVRGLILAVLLASAVAPVAAGQEAPPSLADLGVAAHARPRDGMGPTDVYIAVFVHDVRRIIDVDQTVNVDFVLEARWNDPRLALRGSEARGEIRKMQLDELWHPMLQLVNQMRTFPQFPARIIVDDAGNCIQLQRYIGTVSCPLDLHQFPFDRQSLGIDVVAALHTPDDVRFIADDELLGRAAEFTIVDWNVGEAISETAPIRFREEGLTMAGFRTTMPAWRYANYYVFKVITPLVVIVAMSWSSFWIDPKQVGPKIGIAATSLLTLIAYRFLLGNLVPKVSYLTRLDIFIFGATVLVFTALVESLLSAGLEQRERIATAKRLDRWARAVAPVLLLVLLWHAFLNGA
jgi:hypothetical protein